MRLRTGSKDTSAASGSSITATSITHAMLPPTVLFVKIEEIFGGSPGWPSSEAGCRQEGRPRTGGGSMPSRNDPELALRLTKDIEGRVIAPGDPDYDDARAVFYGGFDRRPAAIVRVASDADVARVIAEARETGLDLAIRSGGHSLVGHSVTEGGIVLDLSEMQALEIDAESRTAWAESGVTAGMYSEAAAEHGLATGFGDAPSVGIGGITLGGGVGFLVRKYGLTIDALLAADVVTAAGEVLRVDEESHPDLFWAIRGGGGNFGVATRFNFRLFDVPTIVGGILILPATLETIVGWAAASESAPEELSTIA